MASLSVGAILTAAIPGETYTATRDAGVTYLTAQSRVPTTLERASSLEGQFGGECVAFARSFLNYFTSCKKNCKGFRGNASDIRSTSGVPGIGKVVLLRIKVPHVAVVVDLQDGVLTLAESNYKLDGIVHVGRKISVDDPAIRGYYELE